MGSIGMKHRQREDLQLRAVVEENLAKDSEIRALRVRLRETEDDLVTMSELHDKAHRRALRLVGVLECIRTAARAWASVPPSFVQLIEDFRSEERAGR